MTRNLLGFVLLDVLMKSSWTLPTRRWVLHSTPAQGGLLGDLTDHWIDVQVRAAKVFDYRLLGLKVAPSAARCPYWLLAADRLDLRLAYKGMFKSGGLSPTWLATQLIGNKPAVMHVHYGPPAAQLTHLARVLDRPLVASFYGYDVSHFRFTQSWLWRRRYRRLFRDGAAFIAEGPAMRDRLIALGCPAEKVHVVRLPVDETALAQCERRTGDDFVVAAAGNFREKKGFDTAIKAFALALKERSDARLLMIGGGELESAHRRLAAEAGVERQITWLGRLPFDEFIASLSTASVALYPSRRAANGDSEGGAPVTMIEAQWLGIPSIASDHDDLPFVAAPGGSIVLPPTRVDLWGEALADLYHNPARTAALGASASRFAREHHSSAENAAKREAVYSAVSNDRPA